MNFKKILIFVIAFTAAGCTANDEVKLFESLSPEDTGVGFGNHLDYVKDFNIYTYRNFYDGGGVAVGDVSGDGLPDIYFVSNMGDNHLYLNKGDFQFEDITETAGVAGNYGWSTGAAMVDINGDGLLDIYVSNSGELDDRRNELFINNGDGTFTESAADYGLDDSGYSIQAVFFDYNGNGFLDLYLINNENEAINTFDLNNNLRSVRDIRGGDRLYKNEGGVFTDITEQAGLFSSIIGFALSASVAYLNGDEYPDLFVANDFFERDYLYLNNGNGTFTEIIDDDRLRSMSAASMGSDIADLSNNGWPDIYVADMLPDEEKRLKSITIFEDWDHYRDKVKWDYGHQFTRNVLHYNMGDAKFSEIGRFSEVQATDWSWAVLLADFSLNGYNDIFVTNGLVQDITNLDYLGEISDPGIMREIISDERVDFQRLIDIIPSVPISNNIFENNGGLRFANRSNRWGLDEPMFSSGAAWADLNGDGALDLIVNNINESAKIYHNRAPELYPERSWLKVTLQGESPNTHAIGAQLRAWAGDQQWYREQFLQRGFQSSVEPGFHVGLGEISRLDSLIIRWPDGRTSRLRDVEVPAHIELSQAGAEDKNSPVAGPAVMPGDFNPGHSGLEGSVFEDVSEQVLPYWSHQKYDYVDFQRERLLLHMRSTEGPGICKGDITGNGLEDVYIGGARGQSGVLFLHQNNGKFVTADQYQQVFEADERSEDTDCVMFDANDDGLLDLYVASGGNSYSSNSSALGDRLYLNNGEKQLRRSNQILPSSQRYVTSSVVEAADFTGDGHIDLFVGARLLPFQVGIPVDGYLLENDGQGQFRDVTGDKAPMLREIGMITDAVWTDWDGDGLTDLVVVGEWMPVRLLRNTGERFEEVQLPDGLSGWWQSLIAADLDGDGRPDLVAGNHGLNSMFRASVESPVRMWVNDFEGNGMIEQILAVNKEGKDYPIALRHELIEELPGLADKYPDYASYAGQTVQDIFSGDQLVQAMQLEAEELASLVIWNREEGPEVHQLPDRAQLAPMYGLLPLRLPETGEMELFMVGNLYEVKPQVGPYDASRGVHIKVEGGQIQSLADQNSSFQVNGSGRGIVSLKTVDGTLLVFVARNNDTPIVFRVLK